MCPFYWYLIVIRKVIPVQTLTRSGRPVRIKLGLVSLAALGTLALLSGCGDDDRDTPAGGSAAGSSEAAGSQGGGGKADAGRSPEDTVRGYLESAATKDCDKSLSLSSKKYWSRGGEQTREQALATCQQRGAVNAQINTITAAPGGDGATTATLTANLTINGKAGDAEFKLVKEDGEWKVDNFIEK